MTSTLQSVYEREHEQMSKGIREQFLEDGFAVVRSLLSESDVAFYVARLRELAGIKNRWTQPDGVNRNPDFWPIIFHDRLLASLGEILGPDVRYLPHNDLHLGFSSFSWHRDSVNRDVGDGQDWDETQEPYRIARVGVYLQRFDDSGFKLGFVKGSHRPKALTGAAGRRAHRRTGPLANIISGLSGVDLLGADADWLATDPGDCVIFDARILHTGSRFHGPKYSIFVAYGLENSHFRNHWHYYLTLRTDLGYSAIAAPLADRLRAAGLLAEEPPANLKIAGAWIPSPTFAYVARRFK
jgi:hypothetical protein